LAFSCCRVGHIHKLWQRFDADDLGHCVAVERQIETGTDTDLKMNAGLVKGEGFAVDASVIEANASRYHGKAPDEIDWLAPERQTHAVVEFLAAFDDEDPDADRKVPNVVSPVDPCSAWTAKANKRVQFGYGLNYLIDLGPHAVIVDVEGTPARTYDEVAATKTMINRTE